MAMDDPRPNPLPQDPQDTRTIWTLLGELDALPEAERAALLSDPTTAAAVEQAAYQQTLDELLNPPDAEA